MDGAEPTLSPTPAKGIGHTSNSVSEHSLATTPAPPTELEDGYCMASNVVATAAIRPVRPTLRRSSVASDGYDHANDLAAGGHYYSLVAGETNPDHYYNNIEDNQYEDLDRPLDQPMLPDANDLATFKMLSKQVCM